MTCPDPTDCQPIHLNNNQHRHICRKCWCPIALYVTREEHRARRASRPAELGSILGNG